MREPDGNTAVFFEVGTDTTLVSGRTILLKDELPKVGAHWDKAACVWAMPACCTHELLAICEANGISVAEAGEGEAKNAELL